MSTPTLHLPARLRPVLLAGAGAALLLGGGVAAQAAQPHAQPPHAKAHISGKLLMTKDLVAAPGQQLVMLTVELPPGAGSPPHRHNAQVFVYVLQGRIVMQLKGKPAVTLGPGQTFYEGVNDIHEVGRNASDTQPAKFLVFMVKKKGAPGTVPVPGRGHGGK